MGTNIDNRVIRDKLRWLRTLTDADPEDQTASDALRDLKAQHPDVAVPQGSDTLTERPQTFEVTDQDSPYSAADLLSRPSGEWVEELLAFLQSSQSIIAKDGFELSIREACRQMPEWGVELATKVKEREEWDTPLWQHLFYSWREDLGAELTERILGIIATDELLGRYQWHIASVLWEVSRNGGRPYFPALRFQANAVAAKLENYIDDSTPDFHGDYFTTAINHPSGMLAEFWIASLSTWFSSQDVRPSQLPEIYRERFLDIVESESSASLLGKAVLCWQLPFLFGLDKQWADEHLIPLLVEMSKMQRATASWHGFVYSTQYWPELLERLEVAFHAAARHMQELFTLESRIRDHFIDRYVSLAVFYAKDPIKDWVPPFFEGNPTPEDRIAFASHLRHILHRMEHPERRRSLWERLLRPYWENRLQGIPSQRPDRRELGQIAEWLPHLKGDLAEAVALAVRGPWAWQDAFILSHEMENEEDTLWRENPKEAAELILHVANSEQPQPSLEWNGKKPLLTYLLQSAAIDTATKQHLREIGAKISLDLT